GIRQGTGRTSRRDSRRTRADARPYDFRFGALCRLVAGILGSSPHGFLIPACQPHPFTTTLDPVGIMGWGFSLLAVTLIVSSVASAQCPALVLSPLTLLQQSKTGIR